MSRTTKGTAWASLIGALLHAYTVVFRAEGTRDTSGLVFLSFLFQRLCHSGPLRIITSMATPAKRAATAKSKHSPKPPSESPEGKPFLRFYYSETLHKKTISLLSTIEQAPDATTHRDALANVAVELANAGMNYYFMQHLKRAKPGFIVEQSANLGMAGVQQVMASVIRQVVGRKESPQLLSVCGSIRQLMR